MRWSGRACGLTPTIEDWVNIYTRTSRRGLSTFPSLRSNIDAMISLPGHMVVGVHIKEITLHGQEVARTSHSSHGHPDIPLISPGGISRSIPG